MNAISFQRPVAAITIVRTAKAKAVPLALGIADLVLRYHKHQLLSKKHVGAMYPPVVVAVAAPTSLRLIRDPV